MSDTVPAQVSDTFERWQSGIAAFDLDKIASAFTEDALFQGLRPNYTLGHDGVRDYYSHIGAGLSVDNHIRETTQLGPDAVLTYSTADFTHADGTTTNTHLTVVLRRADGQWLMSHYHVSRVD